METADPAIQLQSLQQQVQAEVESGRTDEALATARRILALDLKEAQRRQAWDDLVSAFGQQPQRLVPLFEEVLKQKPDDAQLLSRLARLCSASRDFQRAVDYAERAHKLAPQDGEIHYLLAESCYDAGRYSKTLELLADAFRRDVKLQPPGWVLLARPYPALSNTNLLQDLWRCSRRVCRNPQRISRPTPCARSPTSKACSAITRRPSNSCARCSRTPGAKARTIGRLWSRSIARWASWTKPSSFAASRPRSPYQYPSRQSDLSRLYQLKGMTNEAAAAFKAQHAAWLERIKSGQANAGDYNYLAWALCPESCSCRQRRSNWPARPWRSRRTTRNIGDTLAWALMRNGRFEEALARFAPALTNRPVNALLKASAWRALFELAETSVPETLWTASMNRAWRKPSAASQRTWRA